MRQGSIVGYDECHVASFQQLVWGDAGSRGKMSVLPGVRQTRRSEGKQREQRSSDFTLVNVAIALICFCLGVLYGSGPQWSLPKEQAPSPLPFHLEQSVSRCDMHFF